MKKQTAVEKIITEINNELQTLESLHGSEIMGRKIGLAFAKRVAEQAKEMEKKEKIEFACQVAEASAEKYIQGKTTWQIAEELLTFKSE